MEFKYLNGPEVNCEAIASEIKQCIHDNKINMIDYSRTALEVWPNAMDDKYPEMKKYAAQWESFCEFVEQNAKTEDDVPEDTLNAFRAVDGHIQAMVNEDKEYWDALRADVLRYYDKSEDPKYWDERWASIDFWYDPIGLEVQTNKVTRVVNADATFGEEKGRELVSKREIPPGFVIRIN